LMMIEELSHGEDGEDCEPWRDVCLAKRRWSGLCTGNVVGNAGAANAARQGRHGIATPDGEVREGRVRCAGRHTCFRVREKRKVYINVKPEGLTLGEKPIEWEEKPARRRKQCYTQ